MLLLKKSKLMGTTFSSGRIAAATELPINATNSTEVPAGVAARPAQRDVLRAQGTYFGPNFVLDSTGAMAGVSNSMAFWEDILNVLAVGGGNGGASQVLGNVYSNIPPPEMKPCVTLKANLNLVKNSLRLTRVEETAGGAYQIGFKFDTLVDAYVKIYWGATERRRVDSNGKVTYEFVKGNREAIPWLFGPFKAGMDQVFELPANCLINDSLLEQVNLNWISEMDLLATPQIVTPNISSDPLNMPENIIKSVMVNMEPGEAADLIKPIDLRHLIVVIEDAKSEITSTSRISDAQITFANFTQSKDKQLQVRFSKQLLLVPITLIIGRWSILCSARDLWVHRANFY